jgi:hypothetical protein
VTGSLDTGGTRLARPMLGLGKEPSRQRQEAKGEERSMNNIFYIIGVVVVVLFLLGYFGLR